MRCQRGLSDSSKNDLRTVLFSGTNQTPKYCYQQENLDVFILHVRGMYQSRQNIHFYWMDYGLKVHDHLDNSYAGEIHVAP